MRFEETRLSGAFLIHIEPHLDARGLFARLWCRQEFAAHGLNLDPVQSSLSRSIARGTVRGMHLQRPPSTESKLVRCTAGAIHDVIVDLRPGSPTFMKHIGVELSAEKATALYIPPYMAHGFQTLVDNTEVMYQMSDFYAPQWGMGFRWDDPAFAIEWPIRDGISILDRDAAFPNFDRVIFTNAMQVGSAPSTANKGGAHG